MNVEISNYIPHLILSTRHLGQNVLTTRDYDYAFFIFMKFKFYKYTQRIPYTHNSTFFTLLVSTSNSNKVDSSNMTNTINII